MAGALNGIRVLEIANYLTGPYASMLLGDLGAQVIKVEPPDGGDPFRGWEAHGYSSNFRCVNRNKRSVTLDLKSEEGRNILLRLADRSDVLIQNFRPLVVRRLGIDYPTVSKRNPGLIYCSISGFGDDSDEPGYDTVGQARSGLLSLLTDLDAPTPVGISLADHITGVFACNGILAALLARQQTGVGQLVTTSLLQSCVSFAQEAASRYFTTGDTPTRLTRVRSAQVFAFRAGDGLPFVVHLSSPPKFWEGLTRAIERPELQQDVRFIDRAARIRNYDQLREILVSTFLSGTRQRWLTRLQDFDVPCAPIHSIGEVFDDSLVRAMGMQVTLMHPTMGDVQLSGSPITLDRTPISYRSAPPLAGEHTDEILRELGET